MSNQRQPRHCQGSFPSAESVIVLVWPKTQPHKSIKGKSQSAPELSTTPNLCLCREALRSGQSLGPGTLLCGSSVIVSSLPGPCATTRPHSEGEVPASSRPGAMLKVGWAVVRRAQLLRTMAAPGASLEPGRWRSVPSQQRLNGAYTMNHSQPLLVTVLEDAA